jgi:glycogen debranching enzyme
MTTADRVASSPWVATAAVPSLTGTEGAVTLVEGQTFCRSSRSGDITSSMPEGLFVLDTRVISQWQLRVEGMPVEPLAVSAEDPSTATFAAHVHPPDGKADAEVVVLRHRAVGRGMRERIEVQNFGLVSVELTIDLDVDADFADLFQVKEGRLRHVGRHSQELGAEEIRFGHHHHHTTREVTITLSEAASVEPGHVSWHRTLAPRETWEVCLQVTVSVDGQEIEPRFRCGTDDAESTPDGTLARWRATLPTVDTDHPDLDSVLTRSGEDLGSLRIFDPEHPDDPVIAAGAPWYMTLFGRDSLLTAWMCLIADPSLARGVVTALARLQGTEVDPTTEEEPGKILHEVRFAGAEGPAFAHGERYYGSIDATPLFVMLVGELCRWGHDQAFTRSLLPHVDRALEWIERFGDQDGDGFVEYTRASPTGLANQGWKDSWDGIRFADGRLAQTPIALCEVQGYVHGAYVARADLADHLGDQTTSRRYRKKADELYRRFNEAFWSEEHGWYVLGLDGDKQQIDALASNMGHCLWTGIVDPDRAARVAQQLMSPELFTGWGVRTLASSMTAYNPLSYHNGSVWPHDTAICAAGLARYGFVDEAHRIIESQLQVAAFAGDRLPELFAGFDRSEIAVPASYPASCSPQAWAAAAPLLWLRVLLRLDPRANTGEIFMQPKLPVSIRRLEVRGINIGDHELHVRVEGDSVDVGLSTGAPYSILREAQPPR